MIVPVRATNIGHLRQDAEYVRRMRKPVRIEAADGWGFRWVDLASYSRGVWLSFQSPEKIVRHSMIVDEIDLEGNIWVIHSPGPNQTVRRELLDIAQHVLRVEDIPRSVQHQREIFDRAYSAIGAPWRLNQNCEHFLSWCYWGEPTSPQLQSVIVGGALLGLAVGLRYDR